MNAQPEVLRVEGVAKRFGPVTALRDVNLHLEQGEVLGLLGDNGAGKSTLVKIVAGNYRASNGTIRMDGKEVAFHRPVDARTHGIEVVYQDLALCGNLTAASNVYLSRELRRFFGPFSILDHSAMYKRAGVTIKW